MDDETYIVWQDVFNEIAAGRPGSTICPFCSASPMKVEPLSGDVAPMDDDMPSGPVRIRCAQCGKYVEGSFGG